jgi:hypothetical protein
MLLDAYAEVFVWIGADANANEIDEARTLAAAYVAACVTRDGRDPECPVNEIQSGREPPAFTSNFIGWDHSVKNGVGFVDPYEAKLAAAKEKEKRRSHRVVRVPHAEEGDAGHEGGPGFFVRHVRDGTFEMPKLRSTPAKAPESNANGGYRTRHRCQLRHPRHPRQPPGCLPKLPESPPESINPRARLLSQKPS